jgi:predicted CXXCH cytochrome family protein
MNNVTKLMLVVLLLACATALYGQNPNYSGVAVCQGCHNAGIGGTQYTTWVFTLHAKAYDSVSFVQKQMDCSPCHTTGWDTLRANHGADDYITNNGDGTFTVADSVEFSKKINVQCEACHGPVDLAVNHGTAATINLTAERCGTCHQGEHTPYYDEWKMAKHSVSDTNASGYLTGEFRNNAVCSGCHTVQGFLEFVTDPNLDPSVDNPPGNSAEPIVCAACHDPHSNANTAQLRLPPAQLCEKCHNPEYNPDTPTPTGEDLHHSTAYMFEGKGGYQYEGYTYQSSMHKTVMPDKCITCHIVMTPYVSELQPASTGHTFQPKGIKCFECHSDFDTLATTFNYRNVQHEIDSLVSILSGKLAAATSGDSATDGFKRAKFNHDFVDADGSHGIHNTKYARGLLLSAIANFTPTGVELIDETTPKQYALGQNYPNPFNPTTSISFSLPNRQFTSLKIYDIVGNLTATLVYDEMAAGNYRISWNGLNSNGSHAPSGIYFYKLEAGSFKQTKKMILMK